MNNFEPTISSLRLVLKIVQTGKLTTAASQLYVSQSGASHALRVLESQVEDIETLREYGDEPGVVHVPNLTIVLGRTARFLLESDKAAYDALLSFGEKYTKAWDAPSLTKASRGISNSSPR